LLVCVQALDELCEGNFALDRDSDEPVPENWDEYGVADLNDTCASPPIVSCWNSTKRLVGPGCAKAYEWKREKEVRFGWLTTRIKPECERLISEYGDDELELYAPRSPEPRPHSPLKAPSIPLPKFPACVVVTLKKRLALPVHNPS